jgi:chloride channel protein, CIC family
VATKLGSVTRAVGWLTTRLKAGRRDGVVTKARGRAEDGGTEPQAATRGGAPLTGVEGLWRRWPGRAASGWLRSSLMGLALMSVIVGVGAGFGAVAFRWLIFSITWIATGYKEFGQQGRVDSLHFTWLGIWFILIIPIIGGLMYGPLIQRFAKEARGHGVPEVMLAVAENGGRIRPPVSVIKAVASALCIGTGGSVGREGPIVQIGSAFASTLGQVVRMSETRLRIIVACGAAGGISATFNAPLTGLFFGFEIVLREFSLAALFATTLSAVTADLISRSFFGSAPFFQGIPHDLIVHHFATYVLLAVLGIISGLVGYTFKAFLYRLEDLGDTVWKRRPEWARPAVGGIALGAILLALPQMYGVGYPVMSQAIAGKFAIWFLIVLMVGKIAATSMTLSIGGSGGVFAPSLFIGASAGMAFGMIVGHLFGHVVTSPALFGVVAMGAVFGAAAQAPLTAISSVAEMTGNFTLLPGVMLAVGVATALSKRFSYGSIYTTKLLRRGIDIERPTPSNVLQILTVSDAMFPFTEQGMGRSAWPALSADGDGKRLPVSLERWAELVGPVTETRGPQVLFSDETLAQALRQLVLYGRAGLPVVSPDGEHLRGWITRHNVLRVLAESAAGSAQETEQGMLAAEFSSRGAHSRLHVPRTPLESYEVVEITLRPGSPALGQKLGEIPWPPGSFIVAATEGRELMAPRSDLVLKVGERLVVLTPLTPSEPEEAAAEGQAEGRAGD